MTENGGAETEGVALVFMSVRTADAAAFHLHQHFVVADFGDRVFAQFKLARFHQNGGLCFFRDRELFGCGFRGTLLAGCLFRGCRCFFRGCFLCHVSSPHKVEFLVEKLRLQDILIPISRLFKSFSRFLQIFSLKNAFTVPYYPQISIRSTKNHHQEKKHHGET